MTQHDTPRCESFSFGLPAILSAICGESCGGGNAIGDDVPSSVHGSWDVRSVAESLMLRDAESAKRYVAQYLSANQGMRS
jgi:hypothetical protein